MWNGWLKIIEKMEGIDKIDSDPTPFAKREQIVRNCHDYCNDEARIHDTWRNPVSNKISNLGPGDTRRYTLFWIEVLAGAISWGFKSPSPHQVQNKEVDGAAQGWAALLFLGDCNDNCNDRDSANALFARTARKRVGGHNISRAGFRVSQFPRGVPRNSGLSTCREGRIRIRGAIIAPASCRFYVATPAINATIVGAACPILPDGGDIPQDRRKAAGPHSPGRPS